MDGWMDGEMEEEEEEKKEGRGDAIHLMSKFAAARCLSKSLARNSPTGKHRRAVVKTLMKLGVCWREHSVCMCVYVCMCMCMCAYVFVSECTVGWHGEDTRGAAHTPVEQAQRRQLRQIVAPEQLRERKVLLGVVVLWAARTQA